MKLYSRNTVRYSFYYGVSKECSIMVQKISRWYNMLTCKVNIRYFISGNHIQQLIILKVFMIETRCLQF